MLYPVGFGMIIVLCVFVCILFLFYLEFLFIFFGCLLRVLGFLGGCFVGFNFLMIFREVWIFEGFLC